MKGFLPKKTDAVSVFIALKVAHGKLLARDRPPLSAVEHLNSDQTTGMVCNAGRAQDVYDQNATAKGPTVTLKANSAAIRRIEEWINRYPRKILNFKTAEELFALESVV